MSSTNSDKQKLGMYKPHKLSKEAIKHNLETLKEEHEMAIKLYPRAKTNAPQIIKELEQRLKQIEEQEEERGR